MELGFEGELASSFLYKYGKQYLNKQNPFSVKHSGTIDVVAQVTCILHMSIARKLECMSRTSWNRRHVKVLNMLG